MTKREARNVVILFLLVAVLTIAGSYTFNNISFKGTGKAAKTKTEYRVRLTSVSVCTLKDQQLNSKCMAVVGDATNVSDTSIYGSNKVLLSSKLYGEDDAITYKIVIKNEGNLDARVSSIKFDQVFGEPVIYTYNNLVEGEVIKSGSTKEFYVMVSNVSGEQLDNNSYNNVLDVNFSVAN